MSSCSSLTPMIQAWKLVRPPTHPCIRLPLTAGVGAFKHRCSLQAHESTGGMFVCVRVHAVGFIKRSVPQIKKNIMFTSGAMLPCR